MSGAVTEAKPPRVSSAAARAMRRREANRRAARVAREKAAREEERQEKIAPAIQRFAVTAGGVVLRGARVEPDGLAFKRSNPVQHLVRRHSESANPLVTDPHLIASERILISWETGAEGIGTGASNYGERSGGTPQTGYIADAVLRTLNRQIAARDEIAAAQAFLGALWPCVHAVVIRGVDITSWSTTTGLNRHAAVGYVVAALDRLVEFYRGRDRR